MIALRLLVKALLWKEGFLILVMIAATGLGLGYHNGSVTRTECAKVNK